MMRFAICNETFVDWPLDRAFAFAREVGYTGIEIAPFTLGPSASRIDSATRRRVSQIARRNELQIVGLHWLLAHTRGLHLTSPDNQVQQRTARYLSDLARLCRDLGGSVMVLGSPQQRNLAEGVDAAAGVRFASAVIQQAIPALEACQVVLALEPLGPQEGNFLLTAQQAIELARSIDSPQVKLHLDVKAMCSEGKPIPQIIQHGRDWLVHFHANDPNRQGPGMGAVDFAPILRALRDIRYGGWVSVEVFDYSPGVEALATRSITYLQQVSAGM